MPRRGSRAQRIHLLADLKAVAYREVTGVQACPEDFYDHYSHTSLRLLREWAADIPPRSRGRQKGYSGHHAKLTAEVDRLRERGHTERSACAIIARQRRAKLNALRMRYRRAQKQL